jgi:hypothetical protein
MIKNLNQYILTSPPPTLYHYTNQVGLIGILTSWEIWATKIQYMNDTSEFKLSLQLVEDVLKSKFENPISEKERHLITRYLTEIKYIDDINVCVCSFSEVKDSLSLWRGYGAPHSNFAIGFYGEHLSRIAKENRFTLAKCIYDPDIQLKIVTELVEWFVSKPGKLPPINCGSPFLRQLEKIAPLLKNKHFSVEAEWRLVTSLVSATDPHYRVRQGRSSPTPYYRVSLMNKIFDHSMPEIIVGPCPDMELSKSSVEMLAYAAGVSFNDFKVSQIPYRNW